MLLSLHIIHKYVETSKMCYLGSCKFFSGGGEARGWEEMAQQLRAFTLLGEDSGPVPSTHIKHFRTTCNLSK